MSYYLKVLKDNPIGLWKLNENSGSVAFDSSGCGNHGSYVGQVYYNYLPMVPGGKNSSRITNSSYINFPITKDYYTTLSKGSFANKYSSDNDFSLEIWTYLRVPGFEEVDIYDGGDAFTSSAQTLDGGSATTLIFDDVIDSGSILVTELIIFGDFQNNIGIFFEEGNFIFKLGTESLFYSPKEFLRSMHIVCTYSKTNMSMYVNGNLVASKPLVNFLFTNQSINLKSGPIENTEHFMLIDAPAVYRYALKNDQIKSHFNLTNTISPTQIVEPDDGKLFLTDDNSIKKPFSYRYPADKNWSNFYNEDLLYNELDNYIYINPTENSIQKTVTIYDRFAIPAGLNLISSKVEWYGTGGITIATSVDGFNYVECSNGGAIPYYEIGETRFVGNNYVFVKITMSTYDASIFIPRLHSLDFYFYNTKRIYAINGGDYIEPIEPVQGSVDLFAWDYDISSSSNNILSRKKNNGIRPYDPGFSINTLDNIRSVEMIFTPISKESNYLVSIEPNTYFSWNDLGVIAKNNIQAIYINGIDRSSETNISSFLTEDEAHHIVIVFSSAVTSKIWFNVKVIADTWTNAGPRNLYNYISIYKKELSQSVAQNHYNLYTSKSVITAEVPSFSVTESSINVYNNDWVVIKSI
jgi:hypothetical protein